MFVRIDRFPTEKLQDLNQAFGGFVSELFPVEISTRSTQYPPVDITEYANEFVVVAELPGVKKEDVKISVENGSLSISGERKVTGASQDAKTILNEMQSQKFSRVIHLPKNVDTSKISAELQNGILQITVPKSIEAQAREINIK
ncbi:MAG: Hsp20/alpha crystallin family protein [Ignavibacteriales bacterium]|nr:Hsp20/alpha crystallin family protein [Ignavibacteriales bacterium]